MKVGDKVDLLISKDADGTPVAKMGEDGPEGTLQKLEPGERMPDVLMVARSCPEHPNTLHAEVVSTRRSERREPAQRRSTGPARVSNARYRSGWDEIFGPPKEREQPN